MSAAVSFWGDVGVTDGDGWTAWPAPAKLNLSLRITGRRADGYHQLQTVFQLLDWGDTVHLRPRADRGIVRHGMALAGVPEVADLTLLAAHLLRKEAKCAQGVDIRVEKRIPAGAGFGGGSSDAATVLVALDALWHSGLGLDALAVMGRALGADVPVFVHGRSAWAEGVGDALTPLSLPPAWYLLADPGVHVATAAMFAAPELTRHATAATIADFVSGACQDNVFEPVVRRRFPAVDATLNALSRVGQARMTGSGGGCFVAFGDAASAHAAHARLPPGLHSWVAAGAMRPALRDALEAKPLQGRRQEAQGTRF